MPTRRFAPGWPLTLVTVPALALLIALGVWQLHRLAWKTELIARAEAGLAAAPARLAGLAEDPAALDWRRVVVRGRLLAGRNFAFGSTVRDGQPGARLMTPFELPDGTVVLVDRGFLPEARLPPREPPALAVAAEAEITGVLRDRRGDRPGPFTPTNDLAGRRWFRFDAADLARWVGREVVPVVIVAERAAPPEVLAAVTPVRVDLPNRHLGYAVTWFGLAAALLAVYLARGFAPRST